MKPTPRLFLILGLLSSPMATADPVGEIAAKAEAGDPAAQAELGGLYASGEGVAKDVTAALKWLSAAANQGNVQAQMKLGGMYVAGKGVRKNSLEAAKWYMQSALHGHAPAQCQIARMCMVGAGVPKDEVEAFKWATLAATQGDLASKQVLVVLDRKLTRDQVADGLKRARGFLEGMKAAESLNLPADLPAEPVEPAPPIDPE